MVVSVEIASSAHEMTKPGFCPSDFSKTCELRESRKGFLCSFGMEYPGAILHIV